MSKRQADAFVGIDVFGASAPGGTCNSDSTSEQVGDVSLFVTVKECERSDFSVEDLES